MFKPYTYQYKTSKKVGFHLDLGQHLQHNLCEATDHTDKKIHPAPPPSITSSCHDAKNIHHLSVSMSSLPGSGFILRGHTCGTSEAVASLSRSPILPFTVAVLALEVDDLLLPALFFPLLTFLDDAVDFVW